MSAVESLSPAEEERFRHLNTYLEQLHSGHKPDPQALLIRYPELAELVACLQSLDRMAVPDRLALQTTVAFAENAEVPAPSADFQLAKQHFAFEKYELLEEIGRGGMGVVFKARHTELKQVVAIKMVLANQLGSVEHCQRFIAEARAAARLRHPHILGVQDIGQVHGIPYFVMPFVAGANLAQVLRSQPLSPDQAARCLARIARAVAYLHAEGVVHRDLKPANILLDEAGEPLVTDFGLAKVLAGNPEQQTNSGTILGTPSYMSPEQASGKTREVGPLSDVYSLGAVLYEALTGRPPFQGQTMLDTLRHVLEGEPVSPRKLNPAVTIDLETICLRCLEKSQEQRYPSAQALAEDLEHYLKREPLERTQANPFRQLVRWGRREPALVSRLVALAICAAAAQLNYSLSSNITLAGHLWSLAIVGIWAAASFLYQQLLNRNSQAQWVRMLWAGTDVLLITLQLLCNDAVDSPVAVVYPLLIAASGLWFQVSLVWFTTGCSLLGYVSLLAEAWWRQAALPYFYRHLIFMICLAVFGYVVAFQVNRVKALSRFYENRQP